MRARDFRVALARDIRVAFGPGRKIIFSARIRSLQLPLDSLALGPAWAPCTRLFQELLLDLSLSSYF